MSSNTMIFGIYRLGFHSRATVHGFRRSFSTWANENAQGRWHEDAIERQLSHWERDEIRGAYNAAEYLPARVELMRAWNDWLDREADLAGLL
jgi:integrase